MADNNKLKEYRVYVPTTARTLRSRSKVVREATCDLCRSCSISADGTGLCRRPTSSHKIYAQDSRGCKIGYLVSCSCFLYVASPSRTLYNRHYMKSSLNYSIICSRPPCSIDRVLNTLRTGRTAAHFGRSTCFHRIPHAGACTEQQSTD